MDYTYQNLITRIARNLGINSPLKHVEEENIKMSLYDELVETFERSEALKEFKTLNICRDIVITESLVCSTKEKTGSEEMLPPNNYSYKYSFIAETGGETLPSPATVVTVGNDEVVSIIVPERPHGIAYVRLYRNNAKLLDSLGNTTVTDENRIIPVPSVTPRSASTIENPYAMGVDWNSFKTVQFLTSDNRVLSSKEIPEEQFMKWNPSYALEDAESWKTYVLNPEAYAASFTPENAELDGLIGYCILDRALSQFDWKPKFSGKIKFLQVSIPDEIFASLGDTPEMNKAYVMVLVYGATYREMLKRLANAQTEAEIAKWQLLLQTYEAKRKQRASNFAGHISREIDPPVIKAFGLLNDSDMEI